MGVINQYSMSIRSLHTSIFGGWRYLIPSHSVSLWPKQSMSKLKWLHCNTICKATRIVLFLILYPSTHKKKKKSVKTLLLQYWVSSSFSMLNYSNALSLVGVIAVWVTQEEDINSYNSLWFDGACGAWIGMFIMTNSLLSFLLLIKVNYYYFVTDRNKKFYQYDRLN